MELKSKSDDKKFLTVLSDGAFHQTVNEGTEGAVLRTYKDKEDVEHKKYELVFSEAEGIITNIAFHDGEFGRSINIELDNEGIVSLGTSSNYGEDFMKKLPNIDLKQSVRLVPYSFEDGGKSKKGITVYQNEVKLGNYYYDVEAKGATKGMPEPEGDTSKFRSDDWKMHFMVVRKFLMAEVEKVIAANFADRQSSAQDVDM